MSGISHSRLNSPNCKNSLSEFDFFFFKRRDFRIIKCFNFRTFGDIKALRLPRKMVGTGPHRGFAFVEYHSKQDAKVNLTNYTQFNENCTALFKILNI